MQSMCLSPLGGPHLVVYVNLGAAMPRLSRLAVLDASFNSESSPEDALEIAPPKALRPSERCIGKDDYYN